MNYIIIISCIVFILLLCGYAYYHNYTIYTRKECQTLWDMNNINRSIYCTLPLYLPSFKKYGYCN